MNLELAQMGLSLFDNLGDWLGTELNKDKAKKHNAKLKAIYDSYNETFNGPGAQREWGFHLPENNFTDKVLLPTSIDIGKNLLYDLGKLLTTGQEKFFERDPELTKPVSSASIPEGQTESEPQLIIVPTNNEQQTVENNISLNQRNKPVGSYWRANYFDQPYYAKKGIKLIPRQK